MFCQTYRAGAKGSEPERDTVTWSQDFEKSQKVKRELCPRNEASYPGGWSKVGKPTRAPIASTEWKAKPPVNKKADLLQVEKSRSESNIQEVFEPLLWFGKKIPPPSTVGSYI